MNLHFEGQPDITATRSRVWTALLDPRFVVQSAPGVEELDIRSPEAYRMRVGVGVAFFKVHVDMEVRLHDLVPEESARLTATGHAAGTDVAVRSAVRIETLAPDRQRLHWAADGEVHGALAELGVRLLEGTVRAFTEDFWNDFARRVSAER